MPKDILSQADTLTYLASRDDVESCNISGALGLLRRLLEPGKAQHFKRKLLFGISGYDDDPRELYEIPEVRPWMKKLDEAFPYWFYFLNREASTLEFVTFSLCDFVQTADGPLIKPETIADFVSTHFAAMNDFCEAVGEPEEEIEKLSEEIMQFYRASAV